MSQPNIFTLTALLPLSAKNAMDKDVTGPLTSIMSRAVAARDRAVPRYSVALDEEGRGSPFFLFKLLGRGPLKRDFDSDIIALFSH